MRISDWSSDVCSSDLRRIIESPDRWVPATSAGTTDLGWQGIGLSSMKRGRCLLLRLLLQRGRDARRLGDGLQHHAEALGQLSSAEHTSELQSLMRISYAVFCLKKPTTLNTKKIKTYHIYIKSHNHK